LIVPAWVDYALMAVCVALLTYGGYTLLQVLGVKVSDSRPVLKPPRPVPEPNDPGPPFWCGSIWSRGSEIGSSSCNRPAEHFWITTNLEIFCQCSMHRRNSRVPNGREGTQEEVEALIAMYQVMLS